MKTDAWDVRYANAADRACIRDMAQAARLEFEPYHEWAEERFAETFDEDYLRDDYLTIFVVTRHGAPMGFLLASAQQYPAYHGLFTIQQLLYVRPENRGSRAAALLMTKLVAWSEELGAKEVIGGNENAHASERFSSFAKKFGFENVGFAMRKRL